MAAVTFWGSWFFPLAVVPAVLALVTAALGAALSSQDRDGNTALHSAALEGHEDLYGFSLCVSIFIIVCRSM